MLPTNYAAIIPVIKYMMIVSRTYIKIEFINLILTYGRDVPKL